KNERPATGQTSAMTQHMAVNSGNDVPRMIDAATQKIRDTQRGRILASELNTERALQQETQKKLASERALPIPNGERIKQLEEDLRVHHNNISALQREINRAK